MYDPAIRGLFIISLVLIQVSVARASETVDSDAVAKDVITGPVVALDAGTLVINHQKIRLFGIDAPEMSAGEHVQRGALDDVIAGKGIACRVVDRDRYKRAVGICAVDGGPDDLSAWLLEQGLASVYRTFTVDSDRAAAYARPNGGLDWLDGAFGQR